MNPEIIYYAIMENVTKEGKKTPKYSIKGHLGYYPPMEQLIGKDGFISMNLMEKLKEGNHVPSMRLQAKNGLNFTGLKDYFEGGKLSGFAYGYPYDKETYSKDNKPNPFYNYKDDGFLFIIHPVAPEILIPKSIELIVLGKARPLISAYCKQLIMGGFESELQIFRKQLSDSLSYNNMYELPNFGKNIIDYV